MHTSSTTELFLNEQYRKIMNLLRDKELKRALEELSLSIDETSEWTSRNEFEEIVTTYRYMLKYFRNNTDDPQRTKVYNDLIRKAYILNDRVLQSTGMHLSNKYYYTCMRDALRNPRTYAEYQRELESFTENVAMVQLLEKGEKLERQLNELRLRHERTCTELFKKVWTSPLWNAETFTAMQQMIDSVMIPVNDKAMLISGVTLGALQVFDIQKFWFLMDAYRSNEPLVNQRALIGVVLLCLGNSSRLQCEPQVVARLKLLNEDASFLRNLTNIQIQLLRTRETQKVDKKMREEIIPEVIKKSDKLRNFNPDMEESDEDSLFNDKNPDWTEWKEEASELSDKLKEIGDMQLEGIDIYMSTFSQLKSFPFFREIGNWFYPFDPYHTEVLRCIPESDRKSNPIIESILQTGFFCNSDKYSFCFTIEHIPGAKRNLFTTQLNEQQAYERELGNTSKTVQSPEVVSRQYIQDLYRFCKVYPRRNEFNDVFRTPLNLFYCPILKDSIGSVEQQSQITEYLFQKGYYPESIYQYEQLIEQGQKEAETYQKLGFCYQKIKDYEKAVGAYIQADMRQSDNVWTNRHLAQCYRNLKQPQKAIEYYKKVEAVEPENLNLLLYIGQCYVDLQRYDEASDCFFKVEYLEPNSVKAQRAIAWCSFVTNKMDTAQRYYNKLLAQPKPSETDYLNAGHVAWSMKDVSRAADLYIEGSHLMNNPEKFIEMILQDKEELLQHGITDEDIPLMLDIIRYGQSNETTIE